MDWANKIVCFTPVQRDIILKSRHSLLWNKGVPWKKKGDSDFDVPMGSYDGAEICDLVGLYMLSKLQNIEGIDAGVYKDDGLAVSRLNPQQTEAVKKRLCEIF